MSLPPPSGPGVIFAAQSVLGNIGASLGYPHDDGLSYVTDSDEQDEDPGADDLLTDAGSVSPEVSDEAVVPQNSPASMIAAQV